MACLLIYTLFLPAACFLKAFLPHMPIYYIVSQKAPRQDLPFLFFVRYLGVYIMFIKFSFFGVLTLLSTSSALALTCVNDYGGTSSCASNTTAAGDCETLGYSTSDVDNCEHYLYCPFDTSYKRCVTQSETSETVEDCSDYTLESCPTGAICDICYQTSESGGIAYFKRYYKITSCEEGYTETTNLTTGAITCTENGFNLGDLIEDDMNSEEESDPCDDRTTYPIKCTNGSETTCFEEDPCKGVSGCEWHCDTIAGNDSSSSDSSSSGGGGSACDDECSLGLNTCDCLLCKDPKYCETDEAKRACCGELEEREDSINKEAEKL